MKCLIPFPSFASHSAAPGSFGIIALLSLLPRRSFAQDTGFVSGTVIDKIRRSGRRSGSCYREHWG